MKKAFKIILLLLLIFPIKILAFDSSASCAILMDQDSHKIFYAKNIHTVRSIASISKIMTGILAVESGKMDQVVTINESILKAYGSAIYIQVGEEMKLEDLVYGLMLRSGNDAALAIANFVAPSTAEFVKMMNEKAKQIGMKNTTFNNPSGLDEEKGNFSTAYDMAILTSYAMKNATYKKIVGTKKYTVKTNKNVYSWTNKNKLLTTYPYTTGGKTGFTEIAKRTLVSTASKQNLNLVVVTLNDGNDFLDHKNLYEEAFKNYKGYQILTEGPIEIYDEKYYQNYSFYLKDGFSYPLNENEKENILLKINLNKKDIVKNDEEIGKITIYLASQKLGELPVYIKENPQEKTTFLTNFKRWWKSLW